jgi:RimJ/RimL family protein N-acetyltransferase
VITTERLVLRRLQAGDLEAFAAYRRAPEVARYQSWDEGYGAEDAARLLAEQQRIAFGTPGEWVQLAIARREDDALLGDCACHVSASQPRTAEVGVTLAPASQGRGIAAEALGALVGALFRDHGMHRVVAEADDRNAAVHRLLERLGLRCEARLVEADWFKGEWTTLRVYAVLAREWRERS